MHFSVFLPIEMQLQRSFLVSCSKLSSSEKTARVKGLSYKLWILPKRRGETENAKPVATDSYR